MASTEFIPQHDQAEYRMIAPIWHTAVVLLILAALFGWSAYSRSFSPMARHGRMADSLSVLTLEWLLTGLVWWGIRLRGLRLRDLVGGDWPNSKRIFADLLVAVAGMLIQGIIFGMGHGYQGVKLVPVIALYGCLFGLLAQWRRSLRPGIIAHFLQDGIAGDR
jgi:Type II CAAX prenyl endopeptidase Rce1-like